MRPSVRKIAVISIFLAINIALQALGLPKIITGVIVNSIYVILYIDSGFQAAAALAVLTPAAAFFTGHLPPVMVPIAPVIAAGNIVFIAAYAYFKNKYAMPFFRYAVPALVKAAVIFSGGFVAADIFNVKAGAEFLLKIVIFIQFFTALAGIAAGELINSRISKRRPLSN